MELLTYPKTEYLLDASLESLHAESLAWTKELDFWSDEMSFFYNLLHHRKFANSFPSDQIADIDRELVKLNGDELDKIKIRVARHEHELAELFKSSSVVVDDQRYRDAHRELLGDLYTLHQDIRIFKQKVFSFIGK